MLKRGKINKLFLTIGDIAILYCALFLTLILRYRKLPDDIIWSAHKLPFFILFILWLLIFYIAGLYNLEKFISVRELQGRIINTVILAGIIAILMFYLVPQFGITPKTNLLIDLVITLAMLIAWRRFFINRLIGAKKIKILFFGLSKEVTSFISYLKKHPQLGYEAGAVMKISSENQPELYPDIPIIEFDHDIVRIIKENNISLIITAENIRQNKELVRMFYDVLPLGVTIVDFPRFYENITGKVPISLITETWFLENLIELDKGGFETIKRWSDICSAFLLGIPYLAILPFIALAIRLDSPGKIFYRQKRVGKNGKTFEIIKFRTMVQNAEETGAVWAEEKDSRVTRLGNILRKTRIDELPQLWNVLKGELSLVGPRPERPEFVEILKKEVPYYEMRNLVKPGLSGWAQINFPYGASVEDAMQKLQYDLYYIKNRSLGLEISIYLKTLATIIMREGR